MDIPTFMQLTDEERARWVEKLVMGQHGRLRVGERMEGPVGLFKHGRKFVPSSELTSAEEFLDPTIGLTTVMAKQYVLTDATVDGHPHLDIDVGTNNYLHLYEVLHVCDLGDVKAGDVVKMHCGKAKVNVEVTQQMIEDHSHFIFRMAFSK